MTVAETIKKPVTKQVDPSKIMQIGMGFWASKTVLTAVNLELFTHLSQGELSGLELKEKLNLHDRGLYDFLDALVALGFLKRRGLKATAMYSNAEDAQVFLDKNKPGYMGGILEMANQRLYPFWNNLENALKTGTPQNETKTNGESVFNTIYAYPDRLREFIKSMAGIQMGNFMKLSNMFDFSDYTTLCDLGGAGGHLSAQITLNNPHMYCVTFDLPQVSTIAEENISMMGLSEKVSVLSGDFFYDEIPKADVITMGNILHDWDTNEKMVLMKKAYDSLPQGGALIVIENIIDDNRSQNTFGLLMSLNMLIETQGGYDFSAADFNVWARKTGFSRTIIMPLTGPSSAIIAIK